MQTPLNGISIPKKNAARIRSLALYGERCSGTNFVEQLILTNFPKVQLHRDYPFEKHAFLNVRYARSSDLAVVVFRNATDWIKSFHRAKHQVVYWAEGLSLSEFIRHPYSSHAEGTVFNKKKSSIGISKRNEILVERHPLTGQKIPNILQMRSMKIRSHLLTKELFQNVVFVHYEFVNTRPFLFLTILSKTFNMKRIHGSWQVPSERVSPRPYDRKKLGYMPDYSEIGTDEIAFIKGQLDFNVERAIGYVYDQQLNLETSYGPDRVARPWFTNRLIGNLPLGVGQGNAPEG